MIKKLLEWITSPTQETFYPPQSKEDVVKERKENLNKLIEEKYNKLKSELKDPEEFEREVIFPYTNYKVKLVDGSSREFNILKEAYHLNDWTIYNNNVHFDSPSIHRLDDEYQFNNVYIPKAAVISIEAKDVDVKISSKIERYKGVKTQVLKQPCRSRKKLTPSVVVDDVITEWQYINVGRSEEEAFLNDESYTEMLQSALSEIEIVDEFIIEKI